MSALRLGTVLATGVLLGCLVYWGWPAKPARAASLKPDGERHAAPDFALKDADGKTVPTCTNSYMMNGSKEYTLQANKMPAKPSLKVTLVTGSTTTTVPFDLKDIPLP